MEVEKCKYCYEDKELYPNLPIIEDFTETYIDEDGNVLQYMRKINNKYQLVTETGNEEGDVLVLEINYCPMCGRKLV